VILERQCPSSLAAIEALLAAALLASVSFQAGDWQPHEV